MAFEYIADEQAHILNLGGDEYGLIYTDKPDKMEIWVDHGFNGNGCNNLVLNAFGKDLDLEFCRSKDI